MVFLISKKGDSVQNRKTTVIALAAVALTVGALWFTSRAVTPKQATWDDVLAEAKAGAYKIITTEELSERYERDAGSLFLVDTRQEWEFRTGHIQGAVNFPIEPTAWSRWRKASALEALLGPDKDRTIIFY
jgi:3-mercaptopyruvate sulfurtransferase SseA